MDQPIPPSQPRPNDEKIGKKEKPDAAAFKKAKEEAEKTGYDLPQSKQTKKQGDLQNIDDAAKKVLPESNQAKKQEGLQNMDDKKVMPGQSKIAKLASGPFKKEIAVEPKEKTFPQLEKPIEVPDSLRKAILALKQQETSNKPITGKDLVEVFQKADANVPQAKALATEIKEKYPEKAKELEKFIQKELTKLKPEKPKTEHKKKSPFEEFNKSAERPIQKPLEQQALPFTTFNPPPDIRTHAISLASPVQNILPTEMATLFTHMVGALIHMEKKGVATTQIILNNQEFASSRFYGTKVTFERFSTAPNAYNISFTGSEEAVNLIKGNVDGLYKAFNSADLGFKVSDIRAEHEPMIFKRKPAVGQDQGGGI